MSVFVAAHAWSTISAAALASSSASMMPERNIKVSRDILETVAPLSIVYRPCPSCDVCAVEPCDLKLFEIIARHCTFKCNFDSATYQCIIVSDAKETHTMSSDTIKMNKVIEILDNMKALAQEYREVTGRPLVSLAR